MRVAERNGMVRVAIVDRPGVGPHYVYAITPEQWAAATLAGTSSKT